MDAAAKSLRIRKANGSVGSFSTGVAPYMIKPANMLASRQREGVIFVGPSRSSKTMSLIDAWHAYVVTCDPGDMGLYFPTQLLAADFSRRRINRNHENSPDLGGRLSPYAHDNNIMLKVYRNGMMLSLGWPTTSQLAQRDFRYVGFSDYDAMPRDVGDGSPFEVGKNRIAVAGSAGMAMAESSPRFDIIDPDWKPSPEFPHEAPPVQHGIMVLYNQGDRHRWYWPCPDCHEWFEPTFDLLVPGDEEDIEQAAARTVLACPHHGCLIEHRHKTELNSRGDWLAEGESMTADGERVGEPRRSSFASFWLHGVAAAFRTWRSLMLEYMRAMQTFERTGSEEALRTTVNTHQGCPYLPRSMKSERTASELEDRATNEKWTQGFVPSGVRFILGVVDIQGNRFVCSAIGVGVGMEWWLLDRFDIALSNRMDGQGRQKLLKPSAYLEDWDLQVEQLIDKEYPLDDETGRRMPVHMVFCDSGGESGVTPRAYAFYRKLARFKTADGRQRDLRRRYRLVKGDPKMKDKAARVQEVYPDTTDRRDRRRSGARGDVPVLLLNSNLLKDEVMADLARDEIGPGYAHLPPWSPSEVFDELVAETRTQKGWENPARRRNEQIDLCYYAKGGALFLGAAAWGDDWERAPAWAKPWDENPRLTGQKVKAAPVRTMPSPILHDDPLLQ
ncbi:MAG: phage terminase large subunit family protein [Gammaproteobacteria bacterium]|nr:phage terminase large subunit family protein [Gammaproteobacteria bacterium]